MNDKVSNVRIQSYTDDPFVYTRSMRDDRCSVRPKCTRYPVPAGEGSRSDKK